MSRSHARASATFATAAILVAFEAFRWSAFPSSGFAQATRDSTGASVPSDSSGGLAGGPSEVGGSGGGGGGSGGARSSGTDPWAGTADVRPPAFLDTTDRRIRDDRPAPSPEQVAALLEMEAEVDRFTKSGQSYRAAIVSILRREYAQRRRDREQGYARQIREEERLQNDAREAAIRAFERFIRRYPNDPTYTADAMFRLGELYYERSAIEFGEQSESDPGGTSGHPDFTPTIQLYRDLVARFPDYRRIDGVYYLIGYCLNEMGNLEEARMAWLNLVCANRFTYTGAPPTSSPEPDETESSEQHPAASILAPRAAAAEPAFVDPYTDCRPIRADAEFISETWLRIGEYHFDFDSAPHFLQRAISAYSHVLADPRDRNYNLALYKVAWAYYRAARYPEAIAHFSQLVDWSDREQERTGRAGSELRAEAIQYLGITFAYDDWNENQVPDVGEGLPSAVRRLQDPSLLPQDRRWTPEVYFHTGQVFFDQAQYELAVEVWELALRRFPLHHRAPEITLQIARAFRRLNQRDRELQVSQEATRYLPGGEWYDANHDHPREQRQAEEMAEQILIQQAIQHHQTATELRRRAVRDRDEGLLQQAIASYNLAADAYRRYLQLYPNRPDAYELQYNLAECYFWSEQYEEAAQAYAAVRDSNLDDQFLSIAARRVVESLKRLLDQAVARGEITVATEPPRPVGTPPRVTPLQMPELVQRVAQAREVYLARVDERADVERVRSSYDFNNALLLYAYGYWPQARERFQRIYLERCNGPNASPEGQTAYENLNNMAVALEDRAEVVRLARDLQERNCTFSPDSSAPQRDEAFCNSAAGRRDPVCQSRVILTDARFAEAMSLYNEARGSLPANQLCPETVTPQQRDLYERSATEMVSAVNATPNHPDAPVALIQAAVALECTSRNDSAMRLYQRVIDEVGARRASSREEEARNTEILASAYFRLAYSANRNFDYESAIRNYRVLADDRRFSGPEHAERRVDALINAARILEFQQNYQQAAEYYRRAAEVVSDPDTRRAALYRAAEMSFRRRDYAGAIREMQAFLDRYRNDGAAGELLVQAAWRIAESRLALRQEREYRSALQTVVSTFERSGQPPGSMAAEYAAQARFTLANEAVPPLRQRLRVAPGRQRTTAAFIQVLTAQGDANAAQARSVSQGFEPISAYRRPTWTVAANVQQGQIYEMLASALINATLTPVPDDVQATITRARGSAEVRQEVEAQFQDLIRRTVEEQIRPLECYAIVHYALAARLARNAALDTEYSRTAIARLQSYGEERIAECIAEGQTRDAGLAAYSPGEFQRARPGQTMPIEPGLSPPPLAGSEP